MLRADPIQSGRLERHSSRVFEEVRAEEMI
eukprot:COSAG04_NODE_8641_length_947_cov_1.240566_1_plen_29_part_10